VKLGLTGGERQAIERMKQHPDFVSAQWDQAPSRLKAFVEK